MPVKTGIQLKFLDSAWLRASLGCPDDLGLCNDVVGHRRDATRPYLGRSLLDGRPQRVALQNFAKLNQEPMTRSRPRQCRSGSKPSLQN
jgi:hypothetical protein